MEAGRTLTRQFHDRELLLLWEHLAQPLRGVFYDLEGLEEFRSTFASGAGVELEVLEERCTRWIGSCLYTRISRCEHAARVMVQWSLRYDGLADGLLVRPLESVAPSALADYVTRTSLRLPFDGSWFVFWGGRDLIDNAHAGSADQRYAYDFIVLEHGKNFAHRGRANRDYFCYGQPIVAPGAGIVARAVSDVRENTPGTMNARVPLGNHVIIDHQNGEFSYLAHLMPDSVTVAPGDVIEAGVLIGKCGNSGNSSEPHLHFHLQTTSLFARGDGLPARFTNYLRNNTHVASGEPRRGDVVTAT